MASEKTKKIMEGLATVGGGALAGFVDVKFANKMPGGFPLGAVGGAVLAAFGMSGMGPAKARDIAFDVGVGALTFEAGTFAAQQTLKSMLPPSTAPATSGVGAMPYGRGQVGALPHHQNAIQHQQMLQQLAMLEAQYQGRI